MRIGRTAALALAVAAAPATAATYGVRLAPHAPDAVTRLKLFAFGPAASTALYGEGTGAFQLPQPAPSTGDTTFRRVPVRFEVGGRTFAGLATVTFRRGEFDGMVAETLTAEGTPFGASLKVRGGTYAYDDAGTSVNGRVSADVVTTPEPATWATMAAGLGAVGAVLRRSRRRALTLP